MTPHKFFGCICEEACNLLLFCITGNPDYKLTECIVANATGQGREGINRHSRWLELTNFSFYDLQMIFQTSGFWVGADDFEHAV